MNNELFQQAKTAAAERDYQSAIDLYARCLQDQTQKTEEGETGLVYHQIGNCLMKSEKYSEAVEAYRRATADTAYDAVGIVNCNLGMTYTALRDWSNAVKHFEIAVSDRDYPTPYKAYTGMGNALLKQGKSAEAGVAFREAALDERNPNPTKALLNLGVCFMALNRPADAVTSYESALQFDMDKDLRNKFYASLGQAYTSLGEMQKAVDSFEKALEDKDYHLSDSASVDYQRAVGAVAQGTSDNTQALPTIADTSGLDISSDGAALSEQENPYVVSDEVSPDYYFADEFAEQGDQANNEERFFNATDEELEQWSKGMVKLERKRKSVGLKALIVIVLLALVALGTALLLYIQGYGLPTQEMTVEQLFKDASSEQIYTGSLENDQRQEIAALIPEGASINIEGINKSMSTSTAYVEATTAQGGSVRYEVSLVRDLIGWKVSNVGLYFVSQQ